jgi:predicted DNA-binding transcriptional regulator YafY
LVYHSTVRVLTVLELLQSHGRMTGAELARRLEVDIRTVRNYVETLIDLGIPVEAEQGRYGAYFLRAGYKLPPLIFTEDELIPRRFSAYSPVCDSGSLRAPCASLHRHGAVS